MTRLGPTQPAAPDTHAANVRDEGSGRLQVQVSTGGQTFPADEPMEAGGGATGPSPHDLLAAGLAACTTMTLRLYADHKAWPLAAIGVTVDHLRQPDAAPPDLFRRRIALTGPLDQAQKERLMQIADRCPVHRTLTAGSRIETEAGG